MSDAIEELKKELTFTVFCWESNPANSKADVEAHREKVDVWLTALTALQREAQHYQSAIKALDGEHLSKCLATQVRALQSRAETAERERTEFAVALGDEHEICLSLIRERNEAEWERDEALKFGADKLSEMAAERQADEANAHIRTLLKYQKLWDSERALRALVGEMRHWLSIADFCSAEACEKRNELCARADAATKTEVGNG